jgi:hypothetical protein
MDPHSTAARSAALYGAMVYPLIDDWQLIERVLQNNKSGAYVLYRSTDAKQPQSYSTIKDPMNCFEVRTRIFHYA